MMRKNTYLLVAAVICLAAGISGQLVTPDLCDPLVSGITELDVDKYMGTWFEVYRYGDESFGDKADCVKTYLSIHHDNEEPLRIETTYQVLPTNEESTRESKTYFGTASNLNDENTDWNMTLAFKGISWNFDYRIFSTDYTNYAIAYSCQDLNDTHKAEYAWVLVRDTAIHLDIHSTTIEVMVEAAKYLNMDELISVEQSDELCSSSSRFLPHVILLMFVILLNLLK